MTRTLLLSSVAVLVLAPQFASAQTQPPPIPTVTVKTGGETVTSHRFGNPIDSGTSTIDEDAVRDRAPGSGDVNEVLKALPTVQFTNTQGRATREELQDLRPENISISGGSIYENLFVIDGVGANSRLDVDDPASPGAINSVSAATAQTLWLDSSLVGALTVRDSNVSAEFGQFTGGVVEIDTREPRRVFGGEVYYGLTTEDMAKYEISDRARESYGDNGPPDTPLFEKKRYGFSFDLPVSDTFRLLAGYNRSWASVTNFPGNNYLHYGPHQQESLSENFLLKAVRDLPRGMTLTGQATWSPYESEYRNGNAIDNEIISNGGGLNARLELEGSRKDADWRLQLSHAYADNDREAPDINYAISSGAPGYEGCSLGTSCSFGGLGPLSQEQNETALSGRWEQPLSFADLRLGFEFSHIDAERVRSRPAIAYVGVSDIYIGDDVVCAADEGPSCSDGAYAITRYIAYGDFDAQASIDAASLWGELDGEVGGFRVRAGLRYDHESFLGNHNVAPRLAVSRDLPWAGISVTGGLNRYYGRSFLGYALREGQGVTRGYERTGTEVDDRMVLFNDWEQRTHTDPARYSNVGLDTPYSDEATLAFQGPVGWLGGEYRIKGVLREGRDQFASSLTETETIDRETGGTLTRRVQTITNDGERSYRGLSLEYFRNFGPDDAISLSTNVSHTHSTNISYFDVADETELEGALVYYNGEIVAELQALADNQLEDYAAPLIINADWSARWFGGRLRTTVNGRYRSGFDRVGDTFENIRIDGVSYDVYAKQEFSDSLDINLSATAILARTQAGETALDVRVNNLFNSVLNQDYANSSQPWQLGRNLWVSVKHSF